MIDVLFLLALYEAGLATGIGLGTAYLAWLTLASGYLNVMRKAAKMNEGKPFKQRSFPVELFYSAPPDPSPTEDQIL